MSKKMDIERAKAIKVSTDWEAVCKEIDRWIADELSKTRTCSPDQLPKIQATIGAYEEVKVLPDIVIDREE